jgi:hypothetical protein
MGHGIFANGILAQSQPSIHQLHSLTKWDMGCLVEDMQ